MKRKLMGWAATAALTLISANVMAQENAVDRTIDSAQRNVDNAQRGVDNAQRNADNAQRNAQNAAQDNLNRAAPAQAAPGNQVPGRQAPGQQAPGRQAPQNLPDPNNPAGQTFAPPAGANVQGQIQGRGPQSNLNVQSGVGVNNGGAFANIDPNIRWRYRQHNGRWMYWQPSNQWVVWTNNQWLPYSQAFAQPGFQQPGFQQPMYGQQTYGYSNQHFYGNQAYSQQQFQGNTPCNQQTSVYTGQTYPGGQTFYGQQPGYYGQQPYTSGYRGVQQNPNTLPQTRGQAGVGIQGPSPIEPDVNNLPADRDTRNELDRNAPKPAPTDEEKQE